MEKPESEKGKVVKKYRAAFLIFRFSTFAVFDFSLSYFYVAQDLQKVQTPVYGAQGFLPQLSWTLYMESRVVGKRRVLCGNGFAACLDDFALGFPFFRVFIQVELLTAFISNREKFSLLLARRIETNFCLFANPKG